MEARLVNLEMMSGEEGLIPRTMVFGAGYVVLCVLARMWGVSDEDIQSCTFSTVVVSLVAMLVCNYAVIM